MTHVAAGSAVSTVVLQSRGVGVLDVFRADLPAWALAAFAVVTHLGDTAVLLALAALVYLAHDRRAGGFVTGALFAAFAVVIAAKSWFALPRPPVELQAVAVAGFGFPSGHAVGATVGWGALAVTLERVWTGRRRTVLAAAVVASVALSRVALGVHYLVDVLAGVGLGLLVLGAAVRWGREEPLVLFGIAGALAALAVAVSGAALDSVALIGAVGAALVAWWSAIEPTARPAGRREGLAAVGVGLVVTGGIALVDPTRALAFAGAAVLTAGVLVVPVARERWLVG